MRPFQDTLWVVKHQEISMIRKSIQFLLFLWYNVSLNEI